VMGDVVEELRMMAFNASPAMDAASAEVWHRIGLSGDPSTARVPDAAAWGGYPGGVSVTEGRPLFPRKKG